MAVKNYCWVFCHSHTLSTSRTPERYVNLFILSARPVNVIELMEIAVTLVNVILLSESGFSENVFCDIPEQGVWYVCMAQCLGEAYCLPPHYSKMCSVIFRKRVLVCMAQRLGEAYCLPPHYSKIHGVTQQILMLAITTLRIPNPTRNVSLHGICLDHKSGTSNCLRQRRVFQICTILGF
jgi:hypothetical protein